LKQNEERQTLFVTTFY